MVFSINFWGALHFNQGARRRIPTFECLSDNRCTPSPPSSITLSIRFLTEPYKSALICLCPWCHALQWQLQKGCLPQRGISTHPDGQRLKEGDKFKYLGSMLTTKKPIWLIPLCILSHAILSCGMEYGYAPQMGSTMHSICTFLYALG